MNLLKQAVWYIRLLTSIRISLNSENIELLRENWVWDPKIKDRGIPRPMIAVGSELLPCRCNFHLSSLLPTLASVVDEAGVKASVAVRPKSWRRGRPPVGPKAVLRRCQARRLAAAKTERMSAKASLMRYHTRYPAIEWYSFDLFVWLFSVSSGNQEIRESEPRS